MLIRLNGLILIVNAVLPGLLVLTVAGLFVYYKTGVEESWSKDVEPQLLAIQDAATKSILLTRTAVTDASNNIVAAADGLNTVATKFNDAAAAAAPAVATLNSLTAPTFSVQWQHREACVIPGLRCVPIVTKTDVKFGEALGKPFSDAFDAMSAAAQPLADIKAAVNDLGVLGELPAEAQKAQASLAVLASHAIELARSIGTALTAIGYLAIFLVAWFGVQYAVRGFGNIIAGWKMLTTGRAALQG